MSALFVCPIQRVEPDWIDFNGHMNMAYYNLVFDRALDHLYDHLGIGHEFVGRTKRGFFALEVHINYHKEVMLDDPLRVEVQLVDWDHKRMHYSKMMYHDQENYLAASCEQVSMHVNLEERRSCVLADDIQVRLRDLHAQHSQLPVPDHIGRPMGIRRS